MSDAWIRELAKDLGDLVEARSAPERVIDFQRYANDPVGFAVDVLQVKHLWEAQREHLCAVAEHSRVAAYGANGCSKTFDDAILALWWVYSRNGLVVATSAREGQLKDSFMRDVRILFHQAADLAGELYTLDLRRPGHPLSGIRARAAGTPSGLRGEHGPRMMVQLQEAQGLPDFAFESADMMAVGDDDRILCTGNCDLGPVGPFYKRCRQQSNWQAVRFNAEEHPNVVEGRTIIPGGPTRRSLAARASDYGVDSSFYLASVKGEFPIDATEGLVKVQWLDNAFANWERSGFINAMMRGRIVFGIDVARSTDGDRSVVCIARGPRISEFRSWRSADLEVTSGRVIEIARELGIYPLARINTAAENRLCATEIGRALVESQPGCPDPYIPHPRQPLLRFDCTGLGGGPYDRLTAQNWPTDSFMSSSKALGAEGQARFANRRAQAFWTLRKTLEEGEIALPPAHRDDLVKELTAISWAPTGTGKILITSKADIKLRLSGASPDYADSLAIAVAPDGEIDFSSVPGAGTIPL